MQYIISAGIIKGIALAMPKTLAVRNYLNGINVRGTPCGNYLMLEATDGHILIRHAILDYPAPEKPFIVPRAMLDIKVSQSQKRLPLTVTHDGKQIGISWNGSTSTAAALDATYPETTKVVPTTRPSWDVSVLDIDLLSRLTKAAALMGKNKRPTPVIGYNGLNATHVLFRGIEDSQFIIMPMRDGMGLFPDGDLPVQTWASPT